MQNFAKLFLMRMPKVQNFLIVMLLIIIVCMICLMNEQCCDDNAANGKNFYEPKKLPQVYPIPGTDTVYDDNGYDYHYSVDTPLIFVSGMASSGTTLMRVMLDAHPDIRCGEETVLIPRILLMREDWKTNEKQWKRLLEAGIDDNVFGSAISSFILEIIAKHGKPAKILCNKDLMTARWTEYLAKLFPNSKYVLMIRDGRAVAHSWVSRKVIPISNNYTEKLEVWNEFITEMYYQCVAVGEDRCFPMYYEQLVLQPEKWMKDLFMFLNIPWNESVLHHESFISNEISLSKLERMTKHVVKPVNTEALSKWVGNIPTDVVKNMAKIAPMLAHLGYDPNANPPDYGKASDFVKKTNEHFKKIKMFS